MGSSNAGPVRLNCQLNLFSETTIFFLHSESSSVAKQAAISDMHQRPLIATLPPTLQFTMTTSNYSHKDSQSQITHSHSTPKTEHCCVSTQEPCGSRQPRRESRAHGARHATPTPWTRCHKQPLSLLHCPLATALTAAI